MSVVGKRCRHPGCTKGSVVWCGRQQEARVLRPACAGGHGDVHSKRCGHRICTTTQPRYGVAGGKKAVFCSCHAQDGMVDACSKR